MASGDLTFASVSQTMGPVLNNTEASLKTMIDGLGDKPSQAALLDIQVAIQKWTLLIQMQSTFNKELGDAFKGIVQKAA